MEKINEIHRRAMEIAEAAYLARLRGEMKKAEELVREAFEKEREAALLLNDKLEYEPTRSVLYRSAASLAIDCGKTREAERLISSALSGNPPSEIADELRDLLEKVYFERHLSLRGIELKSNEFQFSISGDLVGLGIAQSEEFIERVKGIETLIYRTAERKLNKPFREHGRRKQDIQKDVELYVSIPRAASFAVSFRLGRSRQLKLPGMDLCEDVIGEIFECFDLFNKVEIEPLKKQIADEAYYRNFVGLARNIAPDGKDIRSVGFTALTGGLEKRVVLSTPRIQVISAEPTIEVEKIAKEVQVRGFLRFADARKEEEGLIEIIDEEKKEHKIRVPGGIMADIVRPMFAYEVIVTGRKERKVIILEDIERAPD